MHAKVSERRWTGKDGAERRAWVVRYKDDNGKRRLKAFNRKKDADSFRQKLERQLAAGTHVADADSCTLDEAFEQYIRYLEDEYQAEDMTVRVRRSVYTRHVQPFLGGVLLTHLTKGHVENLKQELLSSGTRSRQTIRKALQLTRTVLNHAVQRDRVGTNVAVHVKLERNQRVQNDGGTRRFRKRHAGQAFPSQGEIQQLVAACPDREKALLLTLIFTGMRISEVVGLAWENVDFDQRRIHVTQRADQAGKLGPVKSAAADRSIPMPKQLAQVLRERKLASKPGQSLVFATRNGRPRMATNVHSAFWRPLQKSLGMVDEAGHPKYRIHDLRHAFAAWRIEQGDNLKTLQTKMGHSTFALTLDVYGGLWTDEDPDALDDEAANLLGNT